MMEPMKDLKIPFSPRLLRIHLDAKAGSRAGVMSSLIGIASRQSIETSQKVKIAELVTFPSVWKG